MDDGSLDKSAVVILGVGPVVVRRTEGTPLDLNNFPEDYGGDRFREGKEVSEESSTTATAEAPDSKRETEILNRARQLVFSNENLAGQGLFLGCNMPPMATGNFSQPVYTRLPSPSSSSMLPQQPLQPYLYPSSSRFLSFPSPYPPPTNDYYVGHVLSPHRPMNPSYSNDSNYTCIGAPINVQAPNAADHSLRFNQANGLNWNCGDGDGPDLDGSPMDRFRNDY
ncbi:hypothetical protein ACLOJK_032981 [Asimina triloba]